ncbi:MAG: histidine kinase dimerization/phospho-acceptor domain-containing protein [Candidatus Zixiibacteriota bacterium]
MFDIGNAIGSQVIIGYLKSLFDSAPLGFFILNFNNGVEYYNAEAARIFGLEHNSSILNYSLHDIESALDIGLGEAVGTVREGNIYRRNEHRCTNHRGHFEVLNIFCMPYRQDDNRISGLLGMVQDVTESYYKKSELEEAIDELSIMWQLSESLSSTTELDNALKIILTGVTANQGLGFNRAFLFLVDETGNNLYGTTAVGPGSPEEAGRIWSQLSKETKTLKELLNNYSQSENNSSPTLTSQINDWVIPLDEQSFFNKAINERQGFNIIYNETLSSDSVKILKRLDSYNIAVAPIICKDKVLGLIAADNKITGRAINDSEVQLLQTFANHAAVAIERSRLYEDIVEHVLQLEEKNKLIADSQEQIVRIEKMSVIGELTSSIAHELRNPLTIIGGFSNLMLSSGKNEANNEYLNIILSEAKRAESVLNQVLDFSRASHAESGELDLGQLVKNTAELFMTRHNKYRNLPVLKRIDEKQIVWGNRDQIQHAIYQFIGLTVDEIIDDCHSMVSLIDDGLTVMLKIEFDGDEKIRGAVHQTLSQIFNNSSGTQKLSIIVAGETIKYHGGSFGIMGAKEQKLPCLYVRLPKIKGMTDG